MYVGEFEGSLVQLAAVSARLERRIELNTRYKEAVSFGAPVFCCPYADMVL